MADKADVLLEKQVVYDGEDYTRGGLETLVTTYSSAHQGKLQTLDELSRAHDALGKEMTAELAEERSAWERLFEKIPGLRALVPERPMHVLLTEKVEIAQRRTQEFGNYVDRLPSEDRLQAVTTAGPAASQHAGGQPCRSSTSRS